MAKVVINLDDFDKMIRQTKMDIDFFRAKMGVMDDAIRSVRAMSNGEEFQLMYNQWMDERKKDSITCGMIRNMEKYNFYLTVCRKNYESAQQRAAERAKRID